MKKYYMFYALFFSLTIYSQTLKKFQNIIFERIESEIQNELNISSVQNQKSLAYPGWEEVNVNIYNQDPQANYTESISLYDQNGNVYEKMTYSTTKYKQNPSYFYYYSYSADGNLINIRILNFLENGEKNLFRHYDYEYENDLLIESNSYIYADGIQINDKRTTFSNYPDSIVAITENYNGQNDSWLIVSKSVYIYEDDLQIEYYSYSYNNGSYLPIWKITSIYDANDNLIENKRYIFNGDWNEDYRNNYYYNSNNMMIEQVNSFVNGSQVTFNTRSLLTYNNGDYLVKEEHFVWENSWIPDVTFNIEQGVDSKIWIINPFPGINILPGSTYSINHMSYVVNSVSIELSTDGGSNWTTIENSSGVNVFSWTLPSNLESNQARIKVHYVENPEVFDITGKFTILNLQSELIHSTEKIEISNLISGYWGSKNGESGIGFKYNSNVNALFTGGFIAGEPDNGLTGAIGSLEIFDTQSIVDLVGIYEEEDFDQVSYAVFKINSLTSDLNDLLIGQKMYSNSSEDIIYITYDVINNTGQFQSDLYVGIFADWDIGNYSRNVGGYDSNTNLTYQYDNSGNDPNYYGIVPLVSPSHSNVTLFENGSNVDFFNQFIFNPLISQNEGDQRTYILCGPYNLVIGEKVKIAFAVSASSSLDDLIVKAQSAILKWNDVLSSVKDYEIIPENITLFQNYPNPFNPNTIIEYSIPNDGFVSLKLYDVLGNEIVTLESMYKKSGNYKVTFNGSHLSSGVYLYTLNYEGRRFSKKLMLIK